MTTRFTNEDVKNIQNNVCPFCKGTDKIKQEIRIKILKEVEEKIKESHEENKWCFNDIEEILGILSKLKKMKFERSSSIPHKRR